MFIKEKPDGSVEILDDPDVKVRIIEAFDVTFNSVENINPPILTFQTQAIPEPSTLALLAVGAVGLLAYLRGSGNEFRSAPDSGQLSGTTTGAAAF